MKKTLIIIGICFSIIFVGGLSSILIISSVNNRTVVLEEAVNESKSNISKEEQRRVDLFNNLVDSIKSYNQHESETLKAVTEARATAQSGNTHTAMTQLNAVF